ncbi:uncharacterized protein V1516DRAFT_82703 [Lipomyces oligophaga]|uniref:uncharacterized protein n=1 Tax=Lipomyces oligophaga TaxID=45792 RepID=UPI0034CF7EA8
MNSPKSTGSRSPSPAVRGRSRRRSGSIDTRSPSGLAKISASRSRSGSGSKSKSRSRSYSRSYSSRSRSPNLNQSRSRSRSRSWTPSSRSRSASYDSRSLSRSRSRTRSRSRSRSPLYRDSSPRRLPKRIVIEHLTRRVTEAHIKEIFSVYGPTSDIRFSSQRDNFLCFLSYDTEQEADSAIAYMDEGLIDGSKVIVQHALPARQFLGQRSQRGGYQRGGPGGMSYRRGDRNEFNRRSFRPGRPGDRYVPSDNGPWSPTRRRSQSPLRTGNGYGYGNGNGNGRNRSPRRRFR